MNPDHAPPTGDHADAGVQWEIPEDTSIAALHHDWCNTIAFAELGDRLIRRLQDARLRLDRGRAVFDHESPSRQDILAYRAAVTDLLDILDTVIRETGSEMRDLSTAAPAIEPRRIWRRMVR